MLQNAVSGVTRPQSVLCLPTYSCACNKSCRSRRLAIRSSFLERLTCIVLRNATERRLLRCACTECRRPPGLLLRLQPCSSRRLAIRSSLSGRVTCIVLIHVTERRFRRYASTERRRPPDLLLRVHQILQTSAFGHSELVPGTPDVHCPGKCYRTPFSAFRVHRAS